MIINSYFLTIKTNANIIYYIIYYIYLIIFELNTFFNTFASKCYDLEFNKKTISRTKERKNEKTI